MDEPDDALLAAAPGLSHRLAGFAVALSDTLSALSEYALSIGR